MKAENEKKIENQNARNFDAEQIKLLAFAPLVQVAWAEGFVQSAERREILNLAARVGISERHQFYGELNEWLDEQPPEAFFREAAETLSAALPQMPPFLSHSLRQILEAGCRKVANAAPDVGVFENSRSKVTPEEREEIRRIGKRLGLRV